MNIPRSLDEILSKQAVIFADQLKQAAAFASNEEEIRIEAEKSLAFIQRQAGINLEGRHEFTIGTGRADSVYDCVIIEYKNPASAADRLSAKRDASGNKKVVDQLKKRFYDMRTEFGRPLNTMFGVGCDGNYFIFIRFRDNRWEVQDPVEVDRHSAERFLWALFNLGTKGKAFAPEYLAGDFGAGAKLAQDGIRALYNTITTTTNPKTQTFFQQWKILFGEVCGYDVNSPSDKIRKLGDFYGVHGTTKPAELLFAVHTYYALFMKLLASEIVAFFHKLPTPLQKIIQSNTSNRLKREMEDLEAGSIFRHFNITNFLEGDLFAWYTAAWCEPIEKLIRDMVANLDGYNPGTLSEDPGSSRDLLKKLYQQLFPKSVRHDLGEYYTPDWLAEHVLSELGYTGDPDKRLLDPACGSGTFLVMAINRVRKWYDENRERSSLREGDLFRKILQNIIGFDLNPLAVMAARTNYLIAIRDLISHVDKVEIPVYLCDSIMTPSEYGDLFTSGMGKAKEFKTSAARFLIPTDIATKSGDIAKYAEQLEFCVRNGYSPEEFIERCHDENLPITFKNLHIDIYNELLKLDKENKNGVWARIIKNAFAPLFIEKVDYVAGNPPWVRWGYLPHEYRNDIKYLWRYYGLFTKKGIESLMGTAELDLSILFTYACIDCYLSTGGMLGFLITQEVIRSKGAGEGFRSFLLSPSRIPLQIIAFHDLVALKPFEAANKTALIIIKKGTKNQYPVPYVEWSKIQEETVSSDDSLEDVYAKTIRVRKQASPLKGNASPWQVVSASSVGPLSKLNGQSSFRGRCGVSVDPYGVFLCRVLSVMSDKLLLITNEPDLGKMEISKMPPSKIEVERIFPAVRGRDIRKWQATPVYAGIIINSSTKKADIPSEKDIKQLLPNTYNYLNQMRVEALAREKFWQFFSRKHLSNKALSHEEMKNLGSYVRITDQTEIGQYVYEVANGPFFGLFNVGTYTFQPFKVAWPMGASKMRAAVLTEYSFEVEGKKTPSRCIIPVTGTTSYVSFNNEDEAHYLCAILNCTLVDAYIRSFSSAGRGFGAPSVVSKFNIPDYCRDSSLHCSLSELSKQCHDAAAKGDMETIAALESEIDKAAAQLWGITDNELKAIQETLKDIEKPKQERSSKKVEDAEEDE